MENSKQSTDCLVIGAGVSGLVAAHALRARGMDYTVLEAGPVPGGLTRSIIVGDYVFDYSGHLLHLARFRTPSEIPFAGLDDAQWMRITRDSRCYVAGALVTAPLQYHLAELPGPLFEQCRKSYAERPRHSLAGSKSFGDYIIAGYGQSLADVFLIPQNEKTWSTSLDRLAVAAARRFLPPPDNVLMEAGMHAEHAAAETYNTHYWYPVSGGIQVLVNALAHPSLRVRCGERVTRIDLEARSATTASGSVYLWRRMLSTMPLRGLCLVTGDPDLREHARALTCGATVVFNLGMHGAPVGQHGNAHWIYVPERSISFYRVGYYSNISEAMAPHGGSAMYVEVGVPGASQPDIAAIWSRARGELDTLGWIDVSRIACMTTQVIACGYTHQTHGTEEVVKAACARLEKFGVFPIGRYGRWDYMSMEDSMLSAIESVARLS